MENRLSIGVQSLKPELLSRTNIINETIAFGLRVSSGIALNKLPKEYRKRFEGRLLFANQKFKNCLQKKINE